MWTAVSGAAAQAQHVDTIANNLANADTLGYKKDLPTFKEYLAVQERERAPAGVPRGPIKDRDFYPLEGRDQSFVTVDGTYTNFRQGNIRVTQSPLDVALDGKGFFEVSTPQGIRYTRHGSFKVATDGRLVTNEGYPVLAAQPGGGQGQALAAENQPSQGGLTTQGGVAVDPGQPIPGSLEDPTVAQRFISLRDRGTNISITESGELYAGADLVARLSVAEFADDRKLRKSGGQLFENRDFSNRIVQDNDGPDATKVHQGALEGSNVNPIEEMTNLIKANRLFEHDLKVLKTYGEIMGREVNDIGSLK